MYKTLSLIIVVLLLAACGQQESLKPTSQSDQTIRALIVGCWGAVYDFPWYQAYSEKTYLADGTSHGVIYEYADKKLVATIHFSGLWDVHKGLLTSTVLDSAPEGVFFSGEKIVDMVSSISQNELVLISRDGERLVRHRVLHPIKDPRTVFN